MTGGFLPNSPASTRSGDTHIRRSPEILEGCPMSLPGLVLDFLM